METNTVIQNQENISEVAEAAIDTATEMASSNVNWKFIGGGFALGAAIIGVCVLVKKELDKKKAKKEAEDVETVEADGEWHVTDEKN